VAINIGNLITHRAAVSPDVEAYVEPENGGRTTFAGLEQYSTACAHLLRQLGIDKGDRIGLLVPNSIELIGLFCGAAKAGIVAVPLNTRLTAAELSFILSDSGQDRVVHRDGGRRAPTAT
jgi:acyl-CoA synthetase (AMP-forming)/AMP-acid ligase II